MSSQYTPIRHLEDTFIEAAANTAKDEILCDVWNGIIPAPAKIENINQLRVYIPITSYGGMFDYWREIEAEQAAKPPSEKNRYGTVYGVMNELLEGVLLRLDKWISSGEFKADCWEMYRFAKGTEGMPESGEQSTELLIPPPLGLA